MLPLIHQNKQRWARVRTARLCVLCMEKGALAHTVKIRAHAENTYTIHFWLKKGGTACPVIDILKGIPGNLHRHTPPSPKLPRLGQILHRSSSHGGEGINRVLLLSVGLRPRRSCHCGLGGRLKLNRSDGGREQGNRAQRQVGKSPAGGDVGAGGSRYAGQSDLLGEGWGVAGRYLEVSGGNKEFYSFFFHLVLRISGAFF